MGKRWGKKRKNRANDGEKISKNEHYGQRSKAYTRQWQTNRKMEAYYALQGLHDTHLDQDTMSFRPCETDEEKEQERQRWMDSLRSILPTSFRLGQDVDDQVRENLEKELDEFVGQELELRIDPAMGNRTRRKKKGGGKEDESKVDSTKESEEQEESEDVIVKKIAPARKLSFIPHAYQLSIDRGTIRRNPQLSKFHNWLTVHTEAGFITRQETVSMIPPVVLGVEPHHKVLDMCAAPGSKTSQILEMVTRPVHPTDKEPSGCVVANDSDAKRAYMLVHQLKRINSPVAFVTACDAQFFPLLKDTQEEGMFDRVLADVPCSGDGTARKNPGVWKQWSQLGSLALHSLQLSIALNGARLTKVGGYLCYSTCAMNPIENEAVVAELLRLTDGSLELVDKRPDVPGLMARPGWTSWRVLREQMSKRQARNKRNKNNPKMKRRRKEYEEKQKQSNGDAAEMKLEDVAEEKKDDNEKEEQKDSVELGAPPSWDEATLKSRADAVGFTEYKSFDEVEEEWQRRARKSCFPPTEEEIAKFNLEKCMRCMPHDMDTGGFFVAMFKKVTPINKRARARALALARELRADVIDDNGTAEGIPEKKKVLGGDAEATSMEEDTDAGKDTEGDATEASVSESKPGKIVKGKSGVLRGKSNSRGDNEGNEDFVAPNENIWPSLIEYYGFSDDFPTRQYMGRSSNSKVLYFIGKPVLDLIDRGLQERITVINSGLKGFERNTNECEVSYRIAQEGIQFLVPYMTHRKMVIDVGDFGKCLETGLIRMDTFSDEFAKRARELTVGSFVVILKGFEQDIVKKLMLVMWRCRGDSLNCLVNKKEIDGMKSKLRAIEEVSADGQMQKAAAAST